MRIQKYLILAILSLPMEVLAAFDCAGFLRLISSTKSAHLTDLVTSHVSLVDPKEYFLVIDHIRKHHGPQTPAEKVVFQRWEDEEAQRKRALLSLDKDQRASEARNVASIQSAVKAATKGDLQAFASHQVSFYSESVELMKSGNFLVGSAHRSPEEIDQLIIQNHELQRQIEAIIRSESQPHAVDTLVSMHYYLDLLNYTSLRHYMYRKLAERSSAKNPVAIHEKLEELLWNEVPAGLGETIKAIAENDETKALRGFGRSVAAASDPVFLSAILVDPGNPNGLSAVIGDIIGAHTTIAANFNNPSAKSLTKLGLQAILGTIDNSLQDRNLMLSLPPGGAIKLQRARQEINHFLADIEDQRDPGIYWTQHKQRALNQLSPRAQAFARRELERLEKQADKGPLNAYKKALLENYAMYLPQSELEPPSTSNN